MDAFETGPGSHKRHEAGALTARQRTWADSAILKTMASPAAALPAPLVTLVLRRTVAKVHFVGIGRVQVNPTFGREVVQRQQYVDEYGRAFLVGATSTGLLGDLCSITWEGTPFAVNPSSDPQVLSIAPRVRR